MKPSGRFPVIPFSYLFTIDESVTLLPAALGSIYVVGELYISVSVAILTGSINLLDTDDVYLFSHSGDGIKQPFFHFENLWLPPSKGLKVLVSSIGSSNINVYGWAEKRG